MLPTQSAAAIGMGMTRKVMGGGVPPTPITPSSSAANLAALLNTPQSLSTTQQLQRALGLPTPPSTVQRTTVNLPNSATGQTTPQSKPPNDPLFNPKNTTNVYVNNLPLHTPDEALFRLCSPYGKVLSVRVFHREDAPVPGSYGFVLFETLEDARRCIVALHRSRYQASFAKTSKVPNPLLADQLLLPFVGARDDASSLHVRGLAKNTDQHTLELLFVPHFVISFRLGDEMNDGTVVWPTIDREITGKENISPEQTKDVKWKVALIRLKDHDTAEEMIDKLDGAYVRGSETPLSVRFAEAGAWRRVGSNRPKSVFPGYGEEGRLNDAGWVGVDLPSASRAQPNLAFFNMGLGTMGIQQPVPQQQQQQQINRPGLGTDHWISMNDVSNIPAFGVNDLVGLRGLQNLNTLNGLQGVANLQNAAGLANLMQSLNLNSQLGLSNTLPLNSRNGLGNLDTNALNVLGRQDLYGPALFTPAQLQSPVSIRNPNAPKLSSPNGKQTHNTPNDFRTSSHGTSANTNMNSNMTGTPTSSVVRAPPPSPCSPQNGRLASGTVYTPQSFLSSLPAIPEAFEDNAHQSQKLNEALAAQLLGTKTVPLVVEPKHDAGIHHNNSAAPSHMLTPQSSVPSSQASSQPVSPAILTAPGFPGAADNKINVDQSSAQIMSQGMPAQRPRTPARGVGATINMPSAPAAAHLSDKIIGSEMSAIMPGSSMDHIVKTSGGYHGAISAPRPIAVKDDKSPSQVDA
ncbi:hypothetical protein DACRYDRAFT_101364 [Dacryopinax primogenitus]|uniref:RRM domain-containing protein n=1 Tax=Dacryopinax primogenitus (strain DJM 731) TaxID=1858805 RepID=M5FQM5_DACPD|nr:uncharacterized protein DACRYDRAFT_101364 [Dacryopinax primogenitus]EJT99200.1 hypothetical protein DACRYDRAFT_101364 [Dacryopinax primogenitus]